MSQVEGSPSFLQQLAPRRGDKKHKRLIHVFVRYPYWVSQSDLSYSIQLHNAWAWNMERTGVYTVRSLSRLCLKCFCSAPHASAAAVSLDTRPRTFVLSFWVRSGGPWKSFVVTLPEAEPALDLGLGPKVASWVPTLPHCFDLGPQIRTVGLLWSTWQATLAQGLPLGSQR